MRVNTWVSGGHRHRLENSQLGILISSVGLHSLAGGRSCLSLPAFLEQKGLAVRIAQVRAEDCGTEDCIAMELRGSRAAVASFQDRIRGRVLGKPVDNPETGDCMFPAGHLT